MKYQVGDKASFSKTLTEYDVYSFAGITGDLNPVHINKVAAENSMFKKQICHGMLTASFISTVLGMSLPGPGTIYLSQEVRFLKPTYIQDTITAEVEVIAIDEKGRLELSTKVFRQDGDLLVDGKARVLPPRES